MTPDDLDTKTDAELNELFAVEVAGWIDADPDEKRERYRNWVPPGKTISKKFFYTERPSHFCTDTNAVIPFIEGSSLDAQITYSQTCTLWSVRLEGRFTSNRDHMGHSETSFARAAVIALLRAKRSQP